MDQMGLFDTTPKPKPEPAEHVEPHERLRRVCRDGTYMIFLYGDNPCMKTARTHDTDDGGDEPMHVMVKDAMPILEEYCFEEKHNYSGEFGKAVVYLANREAQKRKAKEKGAAWLNTSRFV